MKQKRKRNGIKKVMYTIRLDEDIHKWIKMGGFNGSEIINDKLRKFMNQWYNHQTTIQFENIPPF